VTLTYRRLLIALDGTPWAELLLEVVERWTDPARTTVTLVHVVEEDGPKRVHGAMHLRDVPTAFSYLEHCTERLRRGGRTVEHVLPRARTRDVAKTLAAVADERGSDALLLATHGLVDPRRWVRGSVAQRVLAATRRDVLQWTPRSPKPAPGPRNFLVPLDGERAHETALERVARLGEENDGCVVLVHVLPGPEEGDGLGALRTRLAPHTDRFLQRRRVRRSEEYLTRCARLVARGPVRVRTLIERGDPARVLAALAHRLNTDLVVLASHGRHGLATLGRRHLPGQLIERLDVPLLTVDADPRRGAGSRPLQKVDRS
jgi:nucleotide-binding universal stress UspA family protein